MPDVFVPDPRRLNWSDLREVKQYADWLGEGIIVILKPHHTKYALVHESAERALEEGTLVVYRASGSKLDPKED